MHLAEGLKGGPFKDEVLTNQKMDQDSLFTFEKLRVWQDARSWVKSVYTITRLFLNAEKFGMTSQLNRAAISVPKNITEGSSRKSSKDQAHFTQLAYSSLLETLNLLILVFD
ncbi:MAG: four helix bundle protein [Chthoniobacterales bacterium]